MTTGNWIRNWLGKASPSANRTESPGGGHRETSSFNDIKLLKRFYRRSRKGQSTLEETDALVRDMLQRINAGSAELEIIPFLNKFTTGTITKKEYRQRVRKKDNILYLYHTLLSHASTPEAMHYLFPVLSNSLRMTTDDPFEEREPEFEIVREVDDSAPAIDQCGHSGIPYLVYKVHYAKFYRPIRRPLVGLARGRIFSIARKLPDADFRREILTRLDQNIRAREPEFETYRNEKRREFLREEWDGDSGYW